MSRSTNHRPRVAGVSLKKHYGQHFLRDQSVVDTMLRAVTLTQESSVFEIGCGDGFLTRAILQQPCARLWVFEIDAEWATLVRTQCVDNRLTVFEEDALQIDFAERLGPHKPWVLLANLPYQITFPLLHQLQKNRNLLQEAVIMIQHEVAEKLLKAEGRDYGYSSLFFQHYFEMRSLLKIAPGAFYPPPKIYSRLLYLKPRQNLVAIPEEDRFWRFIKYCFAQPRRTLRNNLAGMPPEFIVPRPTPWDNLRAQQMTMSDFLQAWELLRHQDSTWNLGSQN